MRLLFLRLKDLERALESLAEKQHTNVQAVVQLVNDNEEILQTMKENLRQMFVQSVMQVSLLGCVDSVDVVAF